MPQSAHLEPGSAEAVGPCLPSTGMSPNALALSLRAIELAHTLAWTPGQHASRPLWSRCRKVSRKLEVLLAKLESPLPKAVSDDFHWLHDNLPLLEAELEDTREAFRRPHKLPHVRAHGDTVIPRVAALSDDFLAATEYRFEIGRASCRERVCMLV